MTPPNPTIFPTCYFALTVPGYDVIGLFTECGGLEFEFDVFQYNEGGNHETVYQLPGDLKYPNLHLKRGMTDSQNLREWMWKTHNEPELKEIRLEFRTHGKQSLQAWAFGDAFPVKWVGPRFAASSNEIATEELHIAHSGLTGV
jgi:phage tail-like protein